MPLRVAAIDFLNPAPLMWSFNHEPLRTTLAQRYAIHLTTPANCARQLLEGSADLGLIPIAALTPSLAIVPGCCIASLAQVRSIQLIVKAPHTLASIRTLAADTASRSSVAYTRLILARFYQNHPTLQEATADIPAMLAHHDAALIIGDPALLALEQRAAIEARVGPCTWHDIATLWHHHTGLPWVAAVWALRPEALPGAEARTQLMQDLDTSRDQGLAHTEALVTEWTPRIALPPATIRTYLTHNIHYTLDPDCMRALTTFRTLAAELNLLPRLPTPLFLTP